MDIREIKWNNLDALQLTMDNVVMVVVTGFGPRIAFFGRVGDRNLLFWDDEDRGRKDWKLRGGHRVWLMTTGADESEMTYRPENNPCEFNVEGNSVTVWSALDTINMTRCGLRIQETEGSQFEVASLVKNEGDMLLSCGIWALTCTLPSSETRYTFPLGDDSGWDTFKTIHFRKWGPCDGSFGDSQFAVSEKTLVITPVSRQGKQMFNIPLGIGAMVDPELDITFAKYVKYDYTANYPEGCNCAVYIGPDNYMVEFETMGPYSTVKPGVIKEHIETWILSEGSIGVYDSEALKGLFSL